MCNAHVIYYISYFHFCVSCNIMLNLIHVSWLCNKSYWAHDLLALQWVIWLIFKSLAYFLVGFGLFSMVQLLHAPFWDVGFWSFMHLSFISSGMIALFFSMQWCMSRLTLLFCNWHCKVLEFYYPKLSIIKSPLKKSCGIIIISFTSLFDKSFTQVRVCHTFTRCFDGCHTNTLRTYNITKFQWKAKIVKQYVFATSMGFKCRNDTKNIHITSI